MSIQVQKNKGWLSLSVTEVISILILYLFLIAFHGYRFGDEDMTETLSYALYMNDHLLYPKDPYIQAVAHNTLNERYPFTLTLFAFVSHLDWACFMLHFITSIMLISGLWMIAKPYIESLLGKILLIISALVLTYHLNLGGNEVWYNYYVPSHLAKAIGIWGLVCWVNGRSLAGYAIVALATFAQPVVGAQLALLFLLVDLQRSGIRNISMYRGPLLYAITAGLWVIAVFVTNLVNDKSTSSALFYEIMEARLAHHFFPSYYPLRSWVLLLPTLIFGAFIWRKLNIRIYHLFLWAFGGMLGYIVAIEWLEFPTLLSIQWFKVTVWLKPLAILAIISVMEKWIKLLDNRWAFSFLAILVVFAGTTLSGIVKIFGDKPYHFPGSTNYSSEVDIALQINEKIPPEACLLIPPQVTGIRYFSQRSLYIDYKSNIHTKSYMYEAARRREQLYGLEINMRKSAQDVMAQMKEHYRGLNTQDFQKFKPKGADYVLVTNDRKLDLPSVVSNSFFTLYKL